MKAVKELKFAWYNCVTGEYDYRDTPETDEEALKYLPQSPSAVSLYKIYREIKELSILEAMVQVLSSAIGKNVPEK